MNERSILFKGEMVRAILDGRKTQARKVIKFNIDGRVQKHGKQWHIDDPNAVKACPYGQPGDRLWVRETWADVNTEEGPAICYRADGSFQAWHDFSKEFGPDYGAGPSMNYEKYPGDYMMWWSDLLRGEPNHGWRPSIHMPRWASRITLEVTDVRVERVRGVWVIDFKDISLTEE
jgi:hypothetical protein